MTVIESVVHQPEADQPAVTESKYSRLLSSEEQAYVRHTTAGEKWAAIDTGWLSELSCLLVRNAEGRFPRVLPTPEERAEAGNRIVEIGRDGAVFAIVRPGESCRLEPVFPLQIRCRSGSARIVIAGVPS